MPSTEVSDVESMVIRDEVVNGVRGSAIGGVVHMGIGFSRDNGRTWVGEKYYGQCIRFFHK